MKVQFESRSLAYLTSKLDICKEALTDNWHQIDMIEAIIAKREKDIKEEKQLTNNCKAIILGIEGKHPHYWTSIIKDKRQYTYCDKYQFHDFDGWHFKLTEDDEQLKWTKKRAKKSWGYAAHVKAYLNHCLKGYKTTLEEKSQ